MYHQKQHRIKAPAAAKRGCRPIISDDRLLLEIRTMIRDAQDLGFSGEGYRKVWARLRFQGIKADKERVRRVICPTKSRRLGKPGEERGILKRPLRSSRRSRGRLSIYARTSIPLFSGSYGQAFWCIEVGLLRLA